VLAVAAPINDIHDIRLLEHAWGGVMLEIARALPGNGELASVPGTGSVLRGDIG
jgi:hypothetical protein